MGHDKIISSWYRLAALCLVVAFLALLLAACGNESKTSTPSATITGTAGTITVVASSGNHSMYGQPVTFTATVTDTASGAGTPTGTVNFNDGSHFLGAGPLYSGTAIFTTSALLGGSHSITAIYGGDSNFKTSTSSAITQTVLPANTTIAVTGQSVTYKDSAQYVTLTATVTAAGAAVNEGNVTFTVIDSHENNVGDLGWGTVTGGSASALYSLPGGSGASTYTIDAVYSGGDNFQTSRSTGLASLTVNKAATTTVLTFPDIYLGQDVTLTARVTTAHGSLVNEGTVTFAVMRGYSYAATMPGTVKGDIASAVYSLPADVVWTGIPLCADYSGGDNFLASSAECGYMRVK